MSHSQFNFKSSGIRTNDRRFQPKTEIKRTIGFKTPLQEGNDIFEMHVNPIRQVADNFRNLIMTNHGERLGMYDFGANLNALTFEYANHPNYEKIVAESITNAAEKYIPAISITNIEVIRIDENEKKELNSVGLTKSTILVEYVIPQLNSPRLGIEVDILVGG